MSLNNLPEGSGSVQASIYRKSLWTFRIFVSCLKGLFYAINGQYFGDSGDCQ